MLRSVLSRSAAGCCGYHASLGNEIAFSVSPSTFKFGPGLRRTLGDELLQHGTNAKAAIFTDAVVGGTAWFEEAVASVRKAGVPFVVYKASQVEPTDEGFMDAARFAEAEKPCVFVSIGGGSSIDTCKAANLYSTHPPKGGFLDYVNAPLGKALAPPGPLRPHIAMPTTSGTGSEATGLAICDIKSLGAKTGIGHRYLIPSLAIIDPEVTFTMPMNVVAASGWDVICHAVESYTARPFTDRAALPAGQVHRPLSQGANPFSDIGCLATLELCGKWFPRAVSDPQDHEARTWMAFAATLAGQAFGNAGTALPHGMSYAISGLAKNRGYRPDGYSHLGKDMVPHGISVVLGAPACFARGAEVDPLRHVKAAALLGSRDAKDALKAKEDPAKDYFGKDFAAEAIRRAVIDLMKVSRMPNGLNGVGYTEKDIPALIEKTLPQKRVTGNAPFDVNADVLKETFANSMKLW